MQKPSFGVDLITFFHPDFWGVADESAVIAHGRSQPRAFWDRMLDELAGTGIDSIELTFAPFDWRTAVAAYGSQEAFAAELSRRGLGIATGFFADVAIGGGLHDAATRARYIASARDYAGFLRRAGAEVMVMGLPMRRSWDAEPPLFVDAAHMTQVAAFCHELGAMLLHEGIRLALHTEAHSIFCTARDVDLLMTLTDPVYVGFCPDSAHITLAGSDPVAVVRRHADRILATHWKDATGAATMREPIGPDIHHTHRAFFCALGQGVVDFPAWMRALADAGFAGPSILEIDAVPDPAGELRRSLDHATAIAAARP